MLKRYGGRDGGFAPSTSSILWSMYRLGGRFSGSVSRKIRRYLFNNFCTFPLTFKYTFMTVCPSGSNVRTTAKNILFSGFRNALLTCKQESSGSSASSIPEAESSLSNEILYGGVQS